MNERNKKVARQANALTSGAQYRLKRNEPTIIEIKPGYRKRWREHARCKPSGDYTAVQVAAAMLAALGRIREVNDMTDIIQS